MAADWPTRDREASRPTHFQFSLRSLIWLMTLVAVYLSVSVAGPDWLAEMTGLLLRLAVPAVLTIVVIYRRGYAQTFAIGALFPAAMFSVGSYDDYLDTSPTPVREWLESTEPIGSVCDADRLLELADMGIHCLVVVAFGVLAIIVRRMVEPVPSTPEDRLEESATDESQGPFG